MLRHLLLFAAGALLASCDSGAEYQKAVARDFLDPASAQFRDTRVVNLFSDNGSRVRVYCGEVNAKNRLGAYTGFRRFFYVISRTDSDYVQQKWPSRAIYQPGEVLFAEGMPQIHHQYCEREPGRRTDDELWVNA